MMVYKNYIGTAELDDEAGIFHGEVANIRDVVTFQGSSVDELRTAFQESIDDYLVFCKERGEEPDKPYSGKVLLRLGPCLHRSVGAAAAIKGKSLNSWVVECLQSKVFDVLGSKAYSNFNIDIFETGEESAKIENIGPLKPRRKKATR